MLLPPEPLHESDYLVVESTYGNRLHPEGDPAAMLGDVVRETWERGGVVLIPSFAVGRAQAVLYLLAKLRTEGAIPPHPIFMDSPMAINTTELYCKQGAESHLTPEQVRSMCGAATFLRTREDSMTLNDMEGPLLIVSASGMATGGRVLHHLKRLLPDPANTVLFVGFQAAGTRGEALVNGANEVKIHGSYVPVRARIRRLDALSAHGDRTELIEWLRKTPKAPKRTFVTHGEPSASDAFRRYLRDQLGWQAVVPTDGQQVVLD